MSYGSRKKLLIYYIYEILKDCSDENHPMTQQAIIDKIKFRYDVDCERKAIKNNLLDLEDMGFDIVYLDKGGVYLGARKFEPSEVSMLVDAIFSSKTIDSKHARELSEKLYSDFSSYQRKHYNYTYKANEMIRSDNKQIFYVIDTLNTAIEKRKRVSFDYISYAATGDVANPAKVSPYCLVNNNGKYYLVCSRHAKWGLSNYRIDRIKEIKILDEDATRIEEVKGCTKDFDISKYANEKIYMFGGDSVLADIYVKKESALAYIYEWFGNNTHIRTVDGKLVATVRSNEKALIYWALQYCETMELLAPESTRQKVKKYVKNLAEMYR